MEITKVTCPVCDGTYNVRQFADGSTGAAYNKFRHDATKRHQAAVAKGARG